MVGPSFVLATFGVLITAVLLGAFAVVFLGLTPAEAFTLGAVVSSTDAAAVFAVMRSRNVYLKEHLETLLEFESGSNDPMAVLLTVSMIRLLTAPDSSPLHLIPFFFQQMILGALCGYLAGRAIVWVINRINLEMTGSIPCSAPRWCCWSMRSRLWSAETGSSRSTSLAWSWATAPSCTRTA